ncbi:MAG: CHASE2 domain-containing protein [Anaerolineales bacterium]|nr:CHASE2 domain-containing protein [Anaerolineales bacterium]
MQQRRNPFSRWRRFLLSLRVGLGVALIVLLVWQVHLFTRLRLQLTNIFYVDQPIGDRVVIVALDDASFAAYGRSLTTWPRSYYADLVTIANQGGARVVAFDVLFSEPSGDDDLLAQAITDARRSRTATRTVMPVVGVQFQNGDPFQPTQFVRPTATLRGVVDYLGATNVVADSDGAVRWIPMRLGDTWYSFDVVTYLAYLRIPSSLISELVRWEGNWVWLTDERPLWLDDQDRMMINYFGKPASFPVYSFKAVVEGTIDPAVFEDKIVLVGLMNSAGQSDIYTVPTSINGAQMAGVEIHANILETIIRDRALRPQSDTSQALMIIGLALVMSVIYGQLPRHRYWLWLMLMVGIVVFGWVIFSANMFNIERVVVNLFDSMLALTLPAIGLLAQMIVVEYQLRQRAELLLDSIQVASSQNLSLERILPGIAADLRYILNCDDTAIWLWDSAQRQCQLGYASSEAAPLHDQAFARRAIDARVLLKEGQLLAAPLVWRDTVVGVLVAAPVRGLRPQTRDILNLFVWQTSSIIANANLYYETEQLSNLKTRLIRMASHDLKNPLGVIIGYIEMLEDMVGETPRRFLEQVRKSSDEMLMIVNDILNLERAQRGSINHETFSLGALLRDLTVGFRQRAGAHQQTLLADIPSDTLTILGDERMMRQALNNLIDNALKYTPEGGTITVSAVAKSDQIEIRIQDTGYGMPAEALQNLFQEFYRIRTEATAHIRGTGLGLSLVKAVIESHDGRVSVQSTEGVGSTFTVVLPLSH